MRKLIISFLFVIFLSASYVAGWNAGLNQPQPIPQPQNQVPAVNSEKLWSLIQEWRTVNGFQPYTKDQRLCNIAEDRVTDSFDYHQGFKDKYYTYPYELTEIITEGYDEQDMLSRWLYSASHSAALRMSYKYSCVATANGNPFSYAVQIFSNF